MRDRRALVPSWNERDISVRVRADKRSRLESCNVALDAVRRTKRSSRDARQGTVDTLASGRPQVQRFRAPPEIVANCATNSPSSSMRRAIWPSTDSAVC
jgi:hypothetical protein